MSEFITDDRRCGQCGTPVEGFESEPADEFGNSLGHRVAMSVWTTLEPCGHTFKQATGATLD